MVWLVDWEFLPWGSFYLPLSAASTGAARYTKKVTEMHLFPCFGVFKEIEPCVLGAEIDQQLPNKSLRSNACNAASGK